MVTDGTVSAVADITFLNQETRTFMYLALHA